MNISKQIISQKDKIHFITNLIKREICSDIPNAFWERKKHTITLSYEDNFKETNITTMARAAQMGPDHIE